MTTNQQRAVEVMRNFWHDGRYAVGFDEIVGALADAGLLAPDLPKPRMIGRRGALGGLRPEWGLGFDTVVADGPHVWGGRYRNPLTPEQARVLAHTLLAAADHAEGVGHADAARQHPR